VTADCPRTEYCSVTLNDDSYQAFLYAIRNHYWYQMYIDDLPIWGLYSYLPCCTWSFFYFLNNCVRPHPILIIFGMHLPEWICNKMAVFLLTSCSVCVMICLWQVDVLEHGSNVQNVCLWLWRTCIKITSLPISHLLLLVLEWLLQLISWSHWLLMKTNIPCMTVDSLYPVD